MKWKVCGMRDTTNICEALEINPDYMGFIFYPKSKRYVEKNRFDINQIDFKSTQKVGVFVNESIDTILSKVKQYQLDLVQLHGDEPPVFCTRLYNQGVPYIKAFGIDESFDFSRMSEYKQAAFFILDTASKQYGGTGQTFNWQLLNEYTADTPFFLSGGLGLDEIQQIPSHPMLVGIDINSRFEKEPAIKNISDLKKLQTYIHEI